MTQTNHIQEIDFLSVGGFAMGHADDAQAATGCTVLLFDDVAPAGVSVRGGGPASRETPLLNPLAAATGIHAVLLSGGSAFGLDAAGGVMRYLESHDIGFDVGVTKVPLVCQSCLFDLVIGKMDVRPDAAMAIAACENASRVDNPQGNVGAGMGCTVGKYRGKDYAMKSGLGTYAVQVGDIKVGAVVAVNALGDIFDAQGTQIAGMLSADGKGLRSSEMEMYADMQANYDVFTGNTTIGAIVTNAKFDKAQLCKIAEMAQNGYARAIRPVHTTADGDSIYAASVGEHAADINAVGTLAAHVMAQAIVRGVQAATALDGFRSAQDLGK